MTSPGNVNALISEFGGAGLSGKGTGGSSLFLAYAPYVQQFLCLVGVGTGTLWPSTAVDDRAPKYKIDWLIKKFALKRLLDELKVRNKNKPYYNVVRPSVRALDGDGTTVYRAIQMVNMMISASGLRPIFHITVTKNHTIRASKGDSIDWSMAFYIMGLPTTAMCTTLIMYHLVKVSKTRNSPCFMPNTYNNIIEMLVESSGLYLVVLVVFILFEVTSSPYSRYPAAVLESVIGIAPALILLRVVSRNTNMGPPSDDMDSWPLQCPPRSQTEGGGTHVDTDEVMIIGPEKMVQV
ncbi:uncharacterized protein EV420DRAFT_1733671 [Desarmillaria tabescens]|uniref:Uncharacterized protein n=1 Tax=Armillaria tabescens TaxID=1929756 RepID=A0AA39JBH4_ARMTA|nr:uncharacterized protein EV420DRAFT_1733671 [Desarmillaria tabescens]KAK0439705.1 hypothetical protein EV420DRAFT_1733671 [Desarmillaria tabescens]